MLTPPFTCHPILKSFVFIDLRAALPGSEVEESKGGQESKSSSVGEWEDLPFLDNWAHFALDCPYDGEDRRFGAEISRRQWLRTPISISRIMSATAADVLIDLEDHVRNGCGRVD